MSNTELLELAERCEKATGPDRELDCVIARAAGWTDVHWQKDAIASGWHPYGVCEARIPSYTASLDAAMTLVPEGLTIMLQRRFNWHAEVGYDNAGNALTGPLALCAAALKARASQ